MFIYIVGTTNILFALFCAMFSNQSRREKLVSRIAAMLSVIVMYAYAGMS